MSDLNSFTMATTVHSQNVHGTSGSIYAHTVAMPAADVPQVNTTKAEEPLTWDDLPEDHPCWLYYRSKEEDRKKQLCMPPLPPDYDLSQQYIPEMDRRDRYMWNKSHLLSLPRDIRMRIWEHVLTDPSEPELLVGIDREPFCPSYKLTRPPVPELKFVHAKRRNPNSTSLLQTNRMIYEEALPILYKSVKFMPSDLEGLLPLFLATLSSYARSCIRKICLRIPNQAPTTSFRPDLSKPFFHWAVTCAQVAQLNSTLQQVEIDGEWAVFEKPPNRRAILFPLCKIKAAKKFVPCAKSEDDPWDYNAAFQELLREAEQALKANAELRKERTKADLIERAKRKLEEDRERIMGKMGEEQAMSPPEDTGSYIQDIDAFVEDWDLISMNSGASTPRARAGSVMSKYSDETWPDTASNLVGKAGGNSSADKGYESDAESESWEHIEG